MSEEDLKAQLEHTEKLYAELQFYAAELVMAVHGALLEFDTFGFSRRDTWDKILGDLADISAEVPFEDDVDPEPGP
jgi:hypothetical protein